ncbi:MAG: hypothetical protein J7604_17680 [Sporocytophaga sp.]|uniref:hypothetical protein n=1 Tax=Sporocytophaga sp. TaxID=2231183 RepID=UPI001B21C711|nr:hypothetical protein [Sporocytophaga sp.]MBO9702043.1 hypothetical protein [Sporocytophaga sp.]
MTSFIQNEESIALLIEEHKAHVEALIKRNTYKQWKQYKEIHQTDNNSAFIRKEDFESIEVKHSISIPEDIKYFYQEIGGNQDDFYFQINRMLSADNQLMLMFQYSEAFATALIQYYLKLSSVELTLLSKEIEAFDETKLYKSYSSLLEYLLLESQGFYDLRKQKFNIPILQKIYETFDNKDNLIIHLFVSWIHCGGAGGIILNTNKCGYSGGFMHGEGLKITIDGTEYMYNSNCFIATEKHYLISYKETILKDLEQIRKFVMKRTWVGPFKRL